MRCSSSSVSRSALIGGVAALVVLGVGCAGEAAPRSGLVAVSAAAVDRFTAPPELTGSPVLTFIGVGVDDRFDGGLVFDVEALEQLPVVEIEIDDPWEKRRVIYSGVLMSDLIEAVAPAGASELVLTALDDYEVTMSLDDLADGALLATSADGARIDVGGGGPTRIVFLPDSTVGRDPDLWIWSIETVEAR